MTFLIFPVNEFIIVSCGNSYSLISNISFRDSSELPGRSLSLPGTPGSLVHYLKIRSKYASGLRLEFDYENESSRLMLRVIVLLFDALATESAVVVKMRPLVASFYTEARATMSIPPADACYYSIIL